MGREQEQPEADVIIGVISWQGSRERPERRSKDADRARPAEVIRFAPYLLAKRGRALPPPA